LNTFVFNDVNDNPMLKLNIFIPFILLISSCNILLSQTKITLQHKEYNEEFFILDKNKVNAKTEIAYHWYKAKEIHISYGACEGKPLDGLYKSFYKTNKIRSKGQYEKGIKEGKWTYWDSEGNILKTEEYHLGVLHGKVIEFKNNTPDKVIGYKKGLEAKNNSDTLNSSAAQTVKIVETDTTETKQKIWKRMAVPFKKKSSEEDTDSKKEDKKPKKKTKKEEEEPIKEDKN
jgi:hypothetical protein